MKIEIGGREFDVTQTDDRVTVAGKEFTVSTRWDAKVPIVTVDGLPFRVELPDDRGGPMTVVVDHRPVEVRVTGAPTVRRARAASRAAAPAAAAARGAVTAGMTGVIIEVHVKPGDLVREGDLLGILEAMKMRNEVRAPAAGVVKTVAVAAGSRVNQGDVLMVLDDTVY